MQTVEARIDEIRSLAESAREKPATFGPDLDLDNFDAAADAQSVDSLASLEKQVREAALGIGFDSSEEGRSGSYFQMDRSPIYRKVEEAFDNKLEIMSTEEALVRYPELMYEKCYWRNVAPDKDKYTAQVALNRTEGYFIRVKAGERIDKPIQACLFVNENNISQNVHSVIVLEEDAEANVLTGCTIHPKVRGGLHAGISEFYVGKGAKLTFTMIHNWSEQFDVRPRTGVTVAEDATYVSNYIMLKPVKSLQTFPVARLVGERARAVFNSIVYGLEDSYIDIGSETSLEAAGTRSEAIARTASRDRSVVYSRGRLIGRHNDCKAHLDCRGIVFSEGSTQWAIPDLASVGAPGAELSHEAAISPIAAEEIYYLMSRGVPKDEAISMITRGFLEIDIPGLPPALKRQIDRALEETAKEAL